MRFSPRRCAPPAIAFFATSLVASHAAGLTVERGPYLQATSATSVTILWRFDVPATAALLFAPSGAPLEDVSRSASRTHEVTLTGLEPNTHYAYSIQADGQTLASGPGMFFETARLQGPVRVLLFGDSGKGNEAQMSLAPLLDAQQVDLVAHVGDIVYPSGEDKDYDPNLFQVYPNILRRTPLYPVLGNHDILDGSAWWDNFRLPANRYNENVYSYEWGDALFVALDSNSLGDSQAGWMGEVLAASNKPWKFIVLHHPPYSCGQTSSNYSVRGKIVSLAERHGVDIIFSGHAHDYQRTYPIRAGDLANQSQDPDYIDPPGPVYVITGGGADTRGADDSCWFTRYADSVTHFVRMQVVYDKLTLEAVDASGTVFDRMSITKTHLPANQPPMARLSASAIEGSAPLTVRFDAGALDPEGEVLHYTWELPDGIVVDTENPVHTFPLGQHDVRVTVQDPWGGATRDSLRITVLAPNAPPILEATQSRFSGIAPFCVTFSVFVQDPEGKPLRYEWDFGDGHTSQLQDPTHVYTWAGNYTASLTVTDPRGASNRQVFVVHVRANRPPSIEAATAMPAAGVAPLPVSFNANAVDIEGDSLTFRWDFGDGQVAASADPSHVFREPGLYKVRLVCTDARGAVSNRTLRLVVAPNHPPAVEAYPTTLMVPPAVSASFTAQAHDPEGEALHFRWEFGDGYFTEAWGEGSGQVRHSQVNHTYVHLGLYKVSVTASDPRGDLGRATFEVLVRENRAPTLLLDAEPSSGNAPLQVEFVALARDADEHPLRYAWDFDDGEQDSSATATHVYQMAGRYTPTLTVADPYGGAVTVATHVLVMEPHPSHPKDTDSCKPAWTGNGIPLRLHPNPANPSSTIALFLERPSSVEVEIFDVRGRLVRRLQAGPLGAGERTFVWNGHAQDGARVESGLYLVQASVGGERHVLKLLLTW